jgi:hypothetical protein
MESMGSAEGSSDLSQTCLLDGVSWEALYRTEGQRETHEAVRDALLREDGLYSESGDEKSEGHGEGSVVGVRFGSVKSVV